MSQTMMHVTPEVSADLIPDALLADLLNPDDPELLRTVASFYLTTTLRHALTLVMRGENADENWLADMRTSLAAIAEVLG